MLKQGGVLDLHTLDELDRAFHNEVNTRSEATVSRLDLKAPGSARKQYNQGLQALARNDYKSAADSLRKAVSTYPRFVSAHNALGCVYFRLGQNELARNEFEQAVQFDDHLSNSYLNLGRAELALAHTAAAQAAMEKASALAPLNPNLQLALTYSQFLNHDYAGAIQTTERVHARPHPGTAIVHYFAAASWQAQNNLRETQNQLEIFLSEDPGSPFAEMGKRIVEQIHAREAPTLELTLAVNAAAEQPDTADDTARGTRVLQDLKEKRQIAEAENAAACTSCETGTVQPPPRNEIAANLHAKEAASRTSGGLRLRTAVHEVAVFFTATDHGKAVSDLRRDEVTILDDKQPPASVRGFYGESDLPLRMGLLIDTSESITDRLSFEQSAAATFLQQVLGDENDLAFVAGFSNSIVLVQDFTGDLGQLSRGVGQLAAVGGTAIWDSVAFAADKLAQRKEERPVARILVVISDGDDNSSAVSLKEVIAQAQREDVVVFAVSTRDNDPENHEATGNRALKLLAEETGGAAFFPGTAGHLGHSLAELREVIRSRYLVSYKPAQFHRDGRYRAIHIAAQRSGRKLKVVSRKGYYANQNSGQSQ